MKFSSSNIVKSHHPHSFTAKKKRKRLQAVGFLCRTPRNEINENSPSFSAKKNRDVSYGSVLLRLQSVGSYCHCHSKIEHNIILISRNTI